MDSESEKSWPGRLGIAIPVTDDDVYVFFSLLVVMTIRRVRELKIGLKPGNCRARLVL